MPKVDEEPIFGGVVLNLTEPLTLDSEANNPRGTFGGKLLVINISQI